VREPDLAVGLDGLHELVGHADRDVEVGQVAAVLGVDEGLDVRMVAAQHAHLRAAPGTGRLDGLARPVEHAHVRHRAARARLRAAHVGALRTDRREVVADAAAAPHGLGGLRERRVDPGAAVGHLGDRIADGLDEAVDERGREIGAGGGADPAGGHEALLLRLEELRLPAGALVFGFGGGEGAGDPAMDLGDGAFGALGVLLDRTSPAISCIGRLAAEGLMVPCVDAPVGALEVSLMVFFFIRGGSWNGRKNSAESQGVQKNKKQLNHAVKKILCVS
jgi:hypothetical protein